MCGICGFVDFAGRSEAAPIVEAMTRTLRHRGPDDSGSFTEGPVALGHTRLSIIDLSAAGHQPMSTSDGRLTIVYNGELYNFPELREELARAGESFRSRSDTEVVLTAYARWGEAAFPRLRGMFALAIWDSRSGQLTLARDRFGIKPLYVAAMARGLVFASEIKAILTSGMIPRGIDTAALHEYLWFGNALAPNTLFRGIKKLMPGHALMIDAEHCREAAFWSLEEVQPTHCDYQSAVREVGQRLDAAVKSHLVSDVPVGVFLSGGVDSSAVTAFASRHYGRKLQTYSVDFVGGEGQSEHAKARLIAETFATEHHEIRVGPGNLPDLLERLVCAHDEPFGDAANIPLYLLCEQLRGTLKVVLQGDGGDEVFGGYRRYNVMRTERAWRLAAVMFRVIDGPWFSGAVAFRAQRFLHAMGASQPPERMALLLTVEDVKRPPARVLNAALRREVEASDPFRRYRELYRRLAGLDPVQRMLRTDLSILLPDTFLEKVDKPSMAHGIEVRVPFLDNSLTDYALGLPSKYKVSRGEKKRVLRAALRGIVPDVILDAPKAGFGVPYQAWLRGPLMSFFQDLLRGRKAREWGALDLEEVWRLMEDHVGGRRDNGFLLWKVLQLVLWHDLYSTTDF